MVRRSYHDVVGIAGEYKFFFLTFILEFLLIVAARAYYIVRRDDGHLRPEATRRPYDFGFLSLIDHDIAALFHLVGPVLPEHSPPCALEWVRVHGPLDCREGGVDGVLDHCRVLWDPGL